MKLLDGMGHEVQHVLTKYGLQDKLELLDGPEGSNLVSSCILCMSSHACTSAPDNQNWYLQLLLWSELPSDAAGASCTYGRTLFPSNLRTVHLLTASKAVGQHMSQSVLLLQLYDVKPDCLPYRLVHSASFHQLCFGKPLLVGPNIKLCAVQQQAQEGVQAQGASCPHQKVFTCSHQEDQLPQLI